MGLRPGQTNSTSFKKGQAKIEGSGARKGQVYQHSMFVKVEAFKVYDLIGGLDAFKEWAQANRGDFYIHFMARSMPRELDVTGSITHEHDFDGAAEAFERAFSAVVEARRISEDPSRHVEGVAVRQTS